MLSALDLRLGATDVVLSCRDRHGSRGAHHVDAHTILTWWQRRQAAPPPTGVPESPPRRAADAYVASGTCCCQSPSPERWPHCSDGRDRATDG
jgi:hypothetical protein